MIEFRRIQQKFIFCGANIRQKEKKDPFTDKISLS
jgi:hypothetical protein